MQFVIVPTGSPLAEGLWYTPTETGAYTEVSFQDEPEADGALAANRFWM